jgi:hypothetical protein
MIDRIEYLESIMDSKPSQSIIDGLACIQMCLDVVATGNMDLIKELENGR